MDFPIGELVQCSIEEYHAAPGISSSGLCEILRSPAHYQENYVLNKKPPTDAMRFGTLVHFAIFEPELFKKYAVVQPKFDRRTNAGKIAYADWASKLDPKAIILDADDEKTLLGMLNAIQKNPTAMALFARGRREMSFWWKEPNGILCKMRPDFFTELGEIVDLKTTEDARPGAFKRSIERFDYDLRAAWYLRGARVLNQSMNLKNFGKIFMFHAIEKSPPYANSIYYMTEQMQEVGEFKLRKALKLLNECTAKNTWPAYPNQIQPISSTEWDYNRAVEKYGEEPNGDDSDLVV